MEVLAPVGSIENLKVAVYSGADAIYLSVGKFNARAKCKEITLDNLKECVEFAHIFNVKVYLTVNTIVKNDELLELFEMLKVAVECKVDAFIVQDLAVYKILVTHFTGIEIHASTQMGIHNLDGALFLQKLGFKRIVLSRETTLEDIKLIKKHTNLEVECFVQGALCVAFSGNCYFSSINHLASGNRGECLQPCRLKYSALQDNKIAKQGYLLSPSDLCLVNQLEILKEAGVDSIKIEGRLRRSGYVAQTIKSYKNAILENDTKQEIYKLKKVFSRGEFNEGKYLFLNKDIINPNFQNHMGVTIGKVVKTQKFKNLHKIYIKTNGYNIKSGDGLKFVYNNSQIGVGVGNVEYKNGIYCIYSNSKPQIDSIVNLTLDFENEKKLSSVTKKLNVNINISAIAGNKITASLVCNNSQIMVCGEVLENAQNKPTTKDEIIDCFKKTGDTFYNIKSINVNIDNVFIVKSKLNQFRRNCFDLLKQKILENYNKKIKSKIIKNNLEINAKIHKNNCNYFIFNNFSQIKNINPQNNIFILSPSNYNDKAVKDILNYIPDNYTIFLNLPIIANFLDIKIIDDILNNNKKIVGVMVNNYWGLKYKNNYKIILNYTLNIANDISKEIMMEYAQDFVRSVEPFANDFKQGLLFSGKIALMTFAHCVYKTCFNSKCTKDCVYNNVKYVSENKKSFDIRRTKISTCYFQLLSNKINNYDKFTCTDLRD